ncbi:MAG: type I 3-dehydroquinate dehydratase [Lachnospiraceae bacterium]|nr:type I 3-dehydroquinate dehydratase [Lachnospiraceae bacterium]
MTNVLQIKNKKFGEGSPLICVPVMALTKDAIIEDTKQLVEDKVDIIEWRVDAFEGIHSLNAIRDVLIELKTIVQDTVLLFTFRSQEQGGLISLPYEKIYDIHQVAAESKVVDLIDVEYFQSENIDKEIRILQKMGAKVVTSHHDFYETPSEDVLFMLLEQMKHSHADIVKLAVMPNNTDDVLRLLEETSHFHKRYPNQPLITMSMGKMGCVSRISGEIFGSCVTFGAGKTASAPGQIPYDDLREILAYMGD